MHPKEKAWKLMEAMNNASISIEEWNKCSEYARNSLKRKCMIVISEIWGALDNESNSFNYWDDVRVHLESF